MALPDRGYRKPGQGVIDAFYEGLNKIAGTRYDVVAKFDADLQFPPDMLEKVCDAFIRNSRLGVTGGALYERSGEGQPAKRSRGSDGFVRAP